MARGRERERKSDAARREAGRDSDTGTHIQRARTGDSNSGNR